MKSMRKIFLRKKKSIKLVISIAAIYFFIFSFITGSTYAWFTANASIDTNIFIVDVGTESAWTDGEVNFHGQNQYYFEYELGDGEKTEPIKRDIFIGAKKDDVIGKVEVWDNDDKLYIKYIIEEEDVKIGKAWLYAGLEKPEGGPGQAYTTDDESYDRPGVKEHTFKLYDVSGTYIGDIGVEDTIYIAGKLDVYDNR